MSILEGERARGWCALVFVKVKENVFIQSTTKESLTNITEITKCIIFPSKLQNAWLHGLYILLFKIIYEEAFCIAKNITIYTINATM